MPREFKRSERVSGQLRRELAQLIQSEVKDPAVGLVSVSDVEVSRDLSHAKVFVTVFDPAGAEDSIRALKRAAGFLRSRLGQEMRMRNIPQLHFSHDDSVEKGQHMDKLIEAALKSDRSADKDPESGQ
jgi:ribosome-binding factor A